MTSAALEPCLLRLASASKLAARFFGCVPAPVPGSCHLLGTIFSCTQWLRDKQRLGFPFGV